MRCGAFIVPCSLFGRGLLCSVLLCSEREAGNSRDLVAAALWNMIRQQAGGSIAQEGHTIVIWLRGERWVLSRRDAIGMELTSPIEARAAQRPLLLGPIVGRSGTGEQRVTY